MPNPICRRRFGGNPYPMLAAHMTRSLGQSQIIADASQVGLNPGTSDFTIAFWARPDSLATNNFPFGKGATASAAGVSQGYECLTNSNLLQILIGDSANSTRINYISGSPVFAVGVWVHLVLVFTRAANLTPYVNAAAITGTSIASQPGSVTSIAPFAIGAQSFANGTQLNTWDGSLDAFGFWQRALSAAEAAALYNNNVGLAYRDLSPALKTSLKGWWDEDGNGLDASGNGNNLTSNNGVTYVAGKR